MFPFPFPDEFHVRQPAQPRRPAGDADRRLTYLVRRRLARLVAEHTRQVTVRAQNRVVLLDGTVASAALAEAVAGLVWDVPGVFDVRNSLTWPQPVR